MLIEYNLESDVKGFLEIIDVTSRNLGKYSLSMGLNTLFIDKSELSEGIYFFRILTNNLQIKTERVVILK